MAVAVINLYIWDGTTIPAKTKKKRINMKYSRNPREIGSKTAKLILSVFFDL